MKSRNYLLVAASLLALAAAPALAYEEGTWILRGGVGTVQPKSHSFTYSDEIDSISFDIDDATNMTFTATYMFSQKWAFDVLAAVPFEHDIMGTMDLGSGPVTAKIADTKQLPVTVSLQYHFTPDSDFQPYAGLGFNWTKFSSTNTVSVPDFEYEDPELGYISEVGCLDIDDSTGVALQVGADWAVGETMVVNFDVRWFDIDADVYYEDPFEIGYEKIGTAQVDPLMYSLNIGFHF